MLTAELNQRGISDAIPISQVALHSNRLRGSLPKSIGLCHVCHPPPSSENLNAEPRIPNQT